MPGQMMKILSSGSCVLTSCETAGCEPADHFRGVTKMVGLGRGVEREINDFVLARGARSRLPWYEIAYQLADGGN